MLLHQFTCDQVSCHGLSRVAARSAVPGRGSLPGAMFRLLAEAGFRFAFDEDGLLCAGGISMMGSAAQQGAQVSAKKGDNDASDPGLTAEIWKARTTGCVGAKKASAAKQPLDASPR